MKKEKKATLKNAYNEGKKKLQKVRMMGNSYIKKQLDTKIARYKKQPDTVIATLKSSLKQKQPNTKNSQKQKNSQI